MLNMLPEHVLFLNMLLTYVSFEFSERTGNQR
jgi:hypothetical protein